MIYFYFNDCIYSNLDKYIILDMLKNTLLEYKNVKEKVKENIDGIVTNNEPSKIILNNSNFTLKDCITSLPDRDLRNNAFSLFRKYHYDNFFAFDFELKNYTIEINNSISDALFIAITDINNGILFTIPTFTCLKQNILEINADNYDILKVFNLYGNKENTEFIINLISKQILESLPNFEKFISTIGDCKYSDKFEKSFKELPLNMQETLILSFQKAIDRKGNTKFYADEDLIKDVTPSSSKYKTYELRIFNPMALRIYFNESSNFTFLASIEKKPNPKVQDNDIVTANKIIKQFFE